MPVLVDRFLDDAVEIDVDALYDGQELYLGGIMEHIEEAGVHSGDSACSLPSVTLGAEVIARIRHSTEAIASGVGARGLINIQYALAGDVLYVLEANPRASRTVPFVSKATGTQLAKAAALVMMGRSIGELREMGMLRATGDGAVALPGQPVSVKEAVLPFNRFHTPEGGTVDALLGPEMRSTGEVMGIDRTFDAAFAKTQLAVYRDYPTGGAAFVSVGNRDKRHALYPLKRLADLGFTLWATGGTAAMLALHGLEVRLVRKLGDKRPESVGRPTATELINSGQVGLVFNTPNGQTIGGSPRADGNTIRAAAIAHDVPVITTVAGLEAAVEAIRMARAAQFEIRSLQEWSAV
jgi:carbamoyl-phosphate synthase large subunit